MYLMIWELLYSIRQKWSYEVDNEFAFGCDGPFRTGNRSKAMRQAIRRVAFTFLVLDPAVVILLLRTALKLSLAVQLAGLIAVTTVLKSHTFGILAGGVAGADALAFVAVHAINLTRLRGTAWGLADLAVNASVGGGMLGIVFVAVISNIAIDTFKLLADRDFGSMELTALTVVVVLIAVALRSGVGGAKILAVVGKRFECGHAK